MLDSVAKFYPACKQDFTQAVCLPFFMRVVASSQKPASGVLAKNVKMLRTLRKWSHKELAAEARRLSKVKGLSAKTVSNIENTRHSPSTATLDALALAFGIEPWQLLVPLPAEITIEAIVAYCHELERLNRYFLKAKSNGRSTILRIARLEQTDLSEAV